MVATATTSVIYVLSSLITTIPIIVIVVTLSPEDNLAATNVSIVGGAVVFELQPPVQRRDVLVGDAQVALAAAQHAHQPVPRPVVQLRAPHLPWDV